MLKYYENLLIKSDNIFFTWLFGRNIRVYCNGKNSPLCISDSTGTVTEPSVVLFHTMSQSYISTFIYNSAQNKCRVHLWWSTTHNTDGKDLLWLIWLFLRRVSKKILQEMDFLRKGLVITFTGRESTTKLNSSPHIGFLEPGTMEL